MRRTETYNGLEGIEGSMPIGAVLRVGGKTPQGRIDPKQNDRYSIVVPYQNEKGIRELHPQFGFFNGASDLSKRRTFRGRFVGTELSHVYVENRRAHKLPGKWPNHADRRPACVGDGRKATRYFGRAGAEGFLHSEVQALNLRDAPEAGEDVFAEIECPNELCEFAMNGACKVSSSLRLFRPVWPQAAIDAGAPSPAMTFSNHSIFTTSNLKGFFDHVREVWAGLRQEGEPPVFGLPFVLNLVTKTIPSAKKRFPVTTISVDGDLIEFFKWHASAGREIAAANAGLLAEAAESANEQGVIEGDFVDIASIKQPAE